MLANEVADLGRAQSTAHEGRGILDRDRQVGRLGHATEEADVLGRTILADHRRLQDQPVGADALGMAHLRDLFGDRRTEDGERQRHLSAGVFGDPVPNHPALGIRQLRRFGGKAERGHSVDADPKAKLDLPAHGRAVELFLIIEQRIQDGVDAMHVGDSKTRHRNLPQWLSRGTSWPRQPTRKSRSAPRSACMTRST